MIKFEYPKLLYNYPDLSDRGDICENAKGERQAISNFIDYAKENGWNLHKVHNGEESIQIHTKLEAMEHIFSVDDSHLHVIKNGKVCWMYIVCGNSPEEIFNDWGVPRNDKEGFSKLMNDFCLED